MKAIVLVSKYKPRPSFSNTQFTELYGELTDDSLLPRGAFHFYCFLQVLLVLLWSDLLVEESVPLVAISHDGNGGGVGNKGDETKKKTKKNLRSQQTDEHAPREEI